MVGAMCGRYVSRIDGSLERDWALDRTPPAFESYNVAPAQHVPVVREREGHRTCELLRWGLVPYWAKGIPPHLSTINARLETISTAPTYRDPWIRGQRCILPALGFYAWQEFQSGKEPYYITVAEQPLFGMAGVWDYSETADRVGFDSCAIITMPATPFMAQIDNTGQRMPALLRWEDHQTWLTGSIEAARACLRRHPEIRLRAHPVGTGVNSLRNDDPRLIEAARA